MEDQVEKAVAEVASKDEILAYSNASIDKVEIYEIPTPKGDKVFKAQAVLDFNEISKIMSRAAVNQKKRHPDNINLSDEVIEAAVWLQACIVEPVFTYEECITIAKGSGFWTQSVVTLIKKKCGISTQLMERMSEEFEEAPFVR